MKILTRNSALLEVLLDVGAADSYTAVKCGNRLDYTIEVSEDWRFTMVFNRPKLFEKTGACPVSINMWRFDDWSIMFEKWSVGVEA